jgi:hypothetical protein
MTPSRPTHNRRLGLIGVALTLARNNREAGKALDAVRDELESVMDECGFLVDAPFSWVTVSVRFGLRNSAAPTYGAISKKYGDLPLAIEVDTAHLTGADLATLTKIFKRAVVTALVHAGLKYGRPTSRLEAILPPDGTPDRD